MIWWTTCFQTLVKPKPFEWEKTICIVVCTSFLFPRFQRNFKNSYTERFLCCYIFLMIDEQHFILKEISSLKILFIAMIIWFISNIYSLFIFFGTFLSLFVKIDASKTIWKCVYLNTRKFQSLIHKQLITPSSLLKEFKEFLNMCTF